MCVTRKLIISGIDAPRRVRGSNIDCLKWATIFFFYIPEEFQRALGWLILLDRKLNSLKFNGLKRMPKTRI